MAEKATKGAFWLLKTTLKSGHLKGLSQASGQLLLHKAIKIMAYLMQASL
ncbi:hypothetical protein [Ferruginibacter sp.]